MRNPFFDTNWYFIFFDFFLPFQVAFLDDNLHIVVGDFKHFSTLRLTEFDLTDLSVFLTRYKCTLDKIITSDPELFRRTL